MEERQKHLLTHAAYNESGEVPGSTASYADFILKGLTTPGQELARQLFLQLARPSVEEKVYHDEAATKVTRCRMPVIEFRDDSKPVIKKLSDAYLIVASRNEATGEVTIDLVHEALINGGNRLTRWIGKYYSFLIWKEHLDVLISLSSSNKAKIRNLLTGDLLSKGKNWMQIGSKDLSNSERQYIQDSIRLKI